MANQFRKARRDVRRTSRALRRDRLADYKMSASVIDAMYANLTKTMGRYDRRLDKSAARTMERMRQLQKKARGVSRGVERAEAQAQARYGGLLGAATREEFAAARAEGKATVGEAKARTKAAKGQVKTMDDLVGIAQSSAEEAKAAAEYELNRALAMRTKDDLGLVAQMRHDITMAKLQNRLQLQQMERAKELDFEYQMKLQDELMEQAGEQQGPLIIGLADRVTELIPAIKEFAIEHPDAGVSEIIAGVGEQVGGIGTDETQAVRYLIAKMQQGGFLRGPSASGTYTEGIDAVMYALGLMYPDYVKKYGDQMRGIILAGLQMAWNARTGEAATPAPAEEPSAEQARNLNPLTPDLPTWMAP